MIDALISGKLIRDPVIKIGQSGKTFCNFLLNVPVGDEEPVVISGIAFGDVAERMGRLGKGDALSVTGTLKPTTWNDKTTGEERHGLNVTVQACLSVYDVKRRRPAVDAGDDPKSRPQQAPRRPENGWMTCKRSMVGAAVSTIPWIFDRCGHE